MALAAAVLSGMEPGVSRGHFAREWERHLRMPMDVEAPYMDDVFRGLTGSLAPRWLDLTMCARQDFGSAIRWWDLCGQARILAPAGSTALPAS